MAESLTLWLGFILASGIVVWFAPRAALAFAVVAGVMLPASFLPLGHATMLAPKCPCTVLGARIDVDKAIYVLLDTGSAAPRYHVLPYSPEAASALQAALDATMDGEGSVLMEINGDGSPGFHEDVPPAEPPKRAEQHLLQ